MKKLMTILASAATALFAIGSASADDWTISTSVEEVAPGVLDTLNTTEGNNKYYWFLKDANDATGLIVTNYVDGEGAVISGPADVVSRPDVFEDAINTNYLAIDISDRLYRKVGGVNQGALDAGVTIPENGIYLDTLVMFTAAEEEFDANALGDGDKIAIEYVEREVEEDNVTTTQRCFVVRAGYIGSEQVDATNYVGYLESMGSFDKSKWHRLTVRTIPSIDADNHVGFVVYVDEEPIKYDTNVAAGDDFTATGAALAFYDSNTHALFPSAVNTDENNYNTIAAAAFSGTGAIDDVVLTSETPNFIKSGELIPAEITLGTGIASVTVTVGEDEIDPVDDMATPLVYNLPAGTTSFNLAVTADTANGYTFAGIEGATLTEGVVTWESATPSFTVLATRDSVSYIDDEDNVVECATLSEAFAYAKDGSTITLVYDLNANDVEATAFEGYEIDSNVTLDLNGKTIAAVDTWEDALFTVNSGASLTVIDSSSANTGTIDYDTEYGVFYAEGEVIVGAATGDYGPIIIGPLLSLEDDPDVTVIRAKLDGEGNSTAGGAFSMGGYVDSDSEVSDALVNGYWVVAPEGEEPPTPPATYELTITADSAKVEYTATTNGTAVASGDNIEDGSAIIVVAAPKDGYEYAETPTGWDEGETEGTITATFTVDGEDLEISIPDPTAVTPAPETWTVTITLGDHVANALYCITDDFATTNTLSASGSFTIEKGKSFVFVDVGVDANYELDIEATTNSISGATINEYFFIKPTADASGSIIAKATGGSTYPSYIEDATEQAKYDTWKAAMATAGVDVGDGEAYQDAYLLNCTPAEVDAEKAAFKLNITIDGTTVTVTTPDGKSYNGTVQLKGSNDLSTWTNVESASSSYKFYKAELQ